MSNKAIIKLILIVLWMSVIFFFSAEPGDESAKTSNRIIIKIAETIHHHTLSNVEKEKFIEKFSLTIRKLAHMIEYYILAVLIYLFLKEFYPIDKRLFILTMLLTALYAITDEIHQLYVPGRVGSIIDVLIDSFGALLGTLKCYSYKRKRLKKL